ncbi:MAG: alpha/beta fold hydrolase [Candidatus Sungbacteria bacterium]|nr:alpha/beta fold hydrolase [Candidatus Sungbacteria bacterium]
MIQCFLAKIKTLDHIVLEGIAVLPKQKSDTALFWIHGLSSRFSSGQTLIQELSDACRKNGIGYFKFNTRGHDIASGGGENIIGAGFETFEDCIVDIRAMIRFAKSLGYKKIILAGHSTGANKALYYCHKTRDRAVKKLILLGPISDIAGEIKMRGTGGLKKALKIAEKLAKKNPQALMPPEYGIINTARYLSLYRPGSAEDVFPYHSYEATPRKNWKELKSIRIPLAVVIGARDEYLDRPAKKLIEIFKSQASSTSAFHGIIIQGANHGFKKKEQELAREMVGLITEL